jgi:hypothetical protein
LHLKRIELLKLQKQQNRCPYELTLIEYHRSGTTTRCNSTCPYCNSVRRNWVPLLLPQPRLQSEGLLALNRTLATLSVNNYWVLIFLHIQWTRSEELYKLMWSCVRYKGIWCVFIWATILYCCTARIGAHAKVAQASGSDNHFCSFSFEAFDEIPKEKAKDLSGLTSGCPWPSATVKSPGFFKLGSCFSFF